MEIGDELYEEKWKTGGRGGGYMCMHALFEGYDFLLRELRSVAIYTTRESLEE